MELNKMIDHTLLKPEATEEDINQLCQEAMDYGFKSVCVLPHWVRHAKDRLEGSDVEVATVIGFPLGGSTVKSKTYETMIAFSDKADEVDMVINIGALKSGDFDTLLQEMTSIKDIAGQRVVKAILENCLLTRDEIIRACLLAKQAGLDFVKTSTGFSTGGAEVEDIKLMRETLGPDMGIKASGGIRDRATALAMVEAGATRIGASSSVKIVEEDK